MTDLPVATRVAHVSNPELSRTMRMHQAAPELLELVQSIASAHWPECNAETNPSPTGPDDDRCDCGTIKARELLARHRLEE